MLIKSFSNKKCIHSITNDGCCCCNCIHRYLLIVDNTPLGFKCGVFLNSDELGGGSLMDIPGIDGHAMCEMHTRINQKPDNELEIENGN